MDADDGAPQREHGPIGDEHAGLRQEVDRRGAADDEGDVGEPEGERRAEIAAELEFMADREHDRQVARRRGEEQGRKHPPQRRLDERRQPERQPRLRAQHFDDDGGVEHAAGLPCGNGQISARRAGTQPARN